MLFWCLSSFLHSILLLEITLWKTPGETFLFTSFLKTLSKKNKTIVSVFLFSLMSSTSFCYSKSKGSYLLLSCFPFLAHKPNDPSRLLDKTTPVEEVLFVSETTEDN